MDGLVRSGGARTLYIEDDVWERIQELVKLGYAKNASQLVNLLLAEALDRLGHSGRPVSMSYEALKTRHTALTRKVSDLERQLRKIYANNYRALLTLAQKLGLDSKTFNNLDLIAPKLISQWQGNPSALHLFITLLEQIKEKREIERKLSELRKKIYSARIPPNT
mgnify:CR=1 FL=1